MIRKIFKVYKHSFSGLSRESWLLSTVILINRCGYMAIPFMSLYVTQFLKRPPADAGLIISLFGIGSILGAAVGGSVTDRAGYRPVQIITSITSGFFFFLFAWTHNFSTLCFLALVISFFAEAFRPANFTAIAAYAKQGTETRSYSLNRLATNIGWAVGTSVGGILSSFNYKLLFIVDGSISILAGLLILWLLPAGRKWSRKVKEKISDVRILRPWQDKVFVQFFLLTTLFATCFFLMFRVGPLFFKEVWHLNESIIGLLLGLNGILIALFEMILVNRLGNHRSSLYFVIIGVACISLSFLFFMLPASLSIFLAFVSIVVFTLGEMFALPFINTFVISRSNDQNRGQYAAGYTLCWSISQVVGPSGGFYLAGKFGYDVLWISLFVLMLVCAAGYFVLNRKSQLASEIQSSVFAKR